MTVQTIEYIIGGLLRIGVTVAACIVLAGGIIYLVRHGHAHPGYQVFRGEPTDLRSVKGIVSDVIALKSRGIIQLGTLFLVATPVARVFFSFFAFLYKKDWIYIFITSVVLGNLLYSLMGMY